MQTYTIILMVVACVVLGLSIWAFVTRCNTDKFGSCAPVKVEGDLDFIGACKKYQKSNCKGASIDCGKYPKACKRLVGTQEGIWIINKNDVSDKGQQNIDDCPETNCISKVYANCGDSQPDCCDGLKCVPYPSECSTPPCTYCVLDN